MIHHISLTCDHWGGEINQNVNNIHGSDLQSLLKWVINQLTQIVVETYESYESRFGFILTKFEDVLYSTQTTYQNTCKSAISKETNRLIGSTRYHIEVLLLSSSMIFYILLVSEYTPRKINMEPKNHPIEKEHHLPNHQFQVPC